MLHVQVDACTSYMYICVFLVATVTEILRLKADVCRDLLNVGRTLEHQQQSMRDLRAQCDKLTSECARSVADAECDRQRMNTQLADAHKYSQELAQQRGALEEKLRHTERLRDAIDNKVPRFFRAFSHLKPLKFSLLKFLNSIFISRSFQRKFCLKFNKTSEN